MKKIFVFLPLALIATLIASEAIAQYRPPPLPKKILIFGDQTVEELTPRLKDLARGKHIRFEHLSVRDTASGYWRAAWPQLRFWIEREQPDLLLVSLGTRDIARNPELCEIRELGELLAELNIPILWIAPLDTPGDFPVLDPDWSQTLAIRQALRDTGLNIFCSEEMKIRPETRRARDMNIMFNLWANEIWYQITTGLSPHASK